MSNYLSIYNYMTNVQKSIVGFNSKNKTLGIKIGINIYFQKSVKKELYNSYANFF